MAHDVSALIEELKKHRPEARLYLDERFSSHRPDHRLELRKELHRACGDEKVLNLSERPKPEGVFVSVAHCPSIGGFAISKSALGFDIEETDRVDWKIVRRVSNPCDEDGPWAAAHWTAKEAVYKGLGGDQPNIISEIAVLEWKKIFSDYVYNFRSGSGKGTVVRFSGWTAALFTTVSN